MVFPDVGGDAAHVVASGVFLTGWFSAEGP